MPHQPTGRRGSRPRLWRTVAAGVAVVLGLTAQPAVATAAGPRAPVDAELLAELAAGGSTSFTVYLRERAELGRAARLRDSDDRATEVYRQLTGTAERSQRGLRAELDSRGTTYRAFWIANALRVEGDRGLVDALAARPEVASIEPSRSYELVKPVAMTPDTRSGVDAVEWNVDNIEAPRVWSELGVRGEGLVVANIDSGVQYDHPALVGSYRGNSGGTFEHNYNWFDPAEVCPSPAPCDNNGHGTHTMGTMVGGDGTGNQVGVAPGAKWIAAKGCETNNCSDASLLAAGQWVLAPTDLNGQNPRPDLHADVVNNSWGGGRGDEWYEQTVDAWRAAGIFPSFSAGNNGPGCNTTENPGDYPNTYATGSYDVNNVISGFSGRGTSSIDGGVKPNISAPGSNIRSSIPGNGYGLGSGTSMASPHVTATVALVWSAAPSLRGDIAGTERLLDDTATDVDALTCGGTVDDNNTFGEGRLNAYQAVNAAPRGAVGRITGTVTDADGDPVAGARVRAGTVNTVTGPDGGYALTVPAGEHQLTVTAYGYTTGTATVTVAEGEGVVRDFTLAAAPTVRISGRVVDGSGHGWPLYAKIEVAGVPGGPVFTDPVTGAYALTVPGDATYRLSTTVRYPGYRPVTTEIEIGTEARTLDIPVPVQPACTAAGYLAGTSDPLLAESFDGTGTPDGWSVVNRTGDGGWTFTDDGERGNLTGGSGGFAIVDSDRLGSGNTQDTDLVSPPLDLSAATAPLLRFNSDWRAVGVSDTADVDVSTDGGATWTNVWHQTASLRGPRVEEVPLDAAAGAADARVRFRFTGSFAWWWQVDNVQLVNRLCTPEPGGLVVGFTTDANTGAPLDGVTVTSVGEPLDSGVSVATPEDPAIPDGFYWLFSSLTGPQQLSAGLPPYRAAAETVTVVADSTRRADFALQAGRLTVTPTDIEMHQPYGSTRTATVTVTNTGNAPATVGTLERAGRSALLSRRGAALVERPVKGISKGRTGTAYPAGAGASTAPLVDEAWSRLANTPAALFDNSAATLDGKVYSIGGGAGTGTERKAWVYDPAANSWTALPDLPTARSKPSVAALNGRIYVLGGWGDGSLPVATVDVFDPASGTWRTLPGVANPVPRAATASAASHGKVYIVGGCGDEECAVDSTDVVVFDPLTNQFTAVADYPQPVSWLACGGIGGRVYCAGGVGATEFDNGYAYDPDADAWSPLPDMPLDLWGSPSAAAGGLLVLAGGATANSSALTNRTVGYDPVAGAWVDLPNVQFARYRGAASCGAYKVGGSPSSFVGSVESERLGGLDLCAEAGEAPWLSTTPTGFTLAPGESRAVTVTLTATAATGVAQPGRYAVELGLVTDTPYPVPVVDVEMNVSPPASWGKLQGAVLGRTCGGAEVPLRATVRVNPAGDPGTGYTLSADAEGRYAYWLPRGRYDVLVAKDGWVPQAKRQQIQPGLVSTLGVVLDPVTPCPARLGGI
ncbi:S8 family serine peptidase [Plantactinospora sp. CA-290183]|uniref:S8 family serine peptidase n=1 Tax=Plantactinospora sp. CA-290183 TaxID=3240006 RepID=UPI003D8D31C0